MQVTAYGMPAPMRARLAAKPRLDVSSFTENAEKASVVVGSMLRCPYHIMIPPPRREKKSDPTLTPRAGSCAEYPESRLDCLLAVMSGRRLERPQASVKSV